MSRFVVRSRLMRRSRAWFVFFLLSLPIAAHAANEKAEKHRKVSEFQDVTEEERAAARQRARNRMSAWHETDLPPEYHFPWMQIGFVVLAFAVATPFAWSAYKRSAKELKEADAFTQPRKRKAPPAQSN